MGTAKIYFNIRNQTISRVDRMRVMSGSYRYLMAHFDFLTDDWADVDSNKIVIFEKGELSYKTFLDSENEAPVPWELLEEPGTITVSVYGGDRITTGIATVEVSKSGYNENAEESEQEETPGILEQLLGRITEIQTSIESVRTELTERIDNLHDIDGGQFEDWKEGE